MTMLTALLIGAFVSSSAASCLIDKHLRGQWWIVDDADARIQDEAVTVSAHTVEIVKEGRTLAYTCSHTTGHLLQLQPTGGQGYICLEFVPTNDDPTRYRVIRRVHHSTSRISAIAPTGISQCSRSGDLGSVQIRRADPGCTFPSELQGTWDFSGNFIKSINIQPDSLTIEAFDYNAMEFSCERFQMEGHHTYMFALRKAGVTKQKDGCLCFRFQLITLQKDGEKVLEGQRFNAGTPIKLINRGDSIYLHQTCDYVDGVGTDTWHIALPRP